MENALIALQILGAVGVVITVLVIVEAVRRYNKKTRLNMLLAKKRYKESLMYLSQHPDDPIAKEKCYTYGEAFLTYKFPDVYHYPLHEYSVGLDIIDNSEVRKELVHQEINDYLDEHSVDVEIRRAS